MRSAASRLAAFALIGTAAFGLSACSYLFGDDSTDMAAATGSPFTQALARDYTDLAAQAAALPGTPSDDGFFSPITSLFDDTASPGELLQRAFTAKASLATNGEEPQPEAAPDPAIIPARDRLVAAIAAGKAQFPEESARAQSDYDCWVLFGTVASAASASVACKSQLDTSLPRLESMERPAPPAPAPMPVAPPPAPVTQAPIAPPAPAATAANDFTVYFDFDSWTLSAEDLTVLTSVINNARTGGQAHITVVGHTDTSGSDAYNRTLSVRRANVVVEALVDMGARRAAINASGVGETDLAVQTGDGVKEAKNRRSVITLKP